MNRFLLRDGCFNLVLLEVQISVAWKVSDFVWRFNACPKPTVLGSLFCTWSNIPRGTIRHPLALVVVCDRQLNSIAIHQVFTPPPLPWTPNSDQSWNSLNTLPISCTEKSALLGQKNQNDAKQSKNSKLQFNSASSKILLHSTPIAVSDVIS